MNNKKVLFTVQAAAIAAIYVVLTVVFTPLSFGHIQVRFAEALTVLPFFTPAAIPGLFIGCIIGNGLGQAIPLDIVLGSFATLIGALGSYALRRHKFLVPLPPIISNTIVVPFILFYGYGFNLPISLMMLTVGVGEIISCGVLGTILLTALLKYNDVLFKNANAD